MIKYILLIFHIAFVLSIDLHAQDSDTITNRSFLPVKEFEVLLNKKNILLKGELYQTTNEFIIGCNKYYGLVNLESNLLFSKNSYIVFNKEKDYPRSTIVFFIYPDSIIAKNKIIMITQTLKNKTKVNEIIKCLKGQNFFIYKNMLISAKCFSHDFEEIIKEITGDYPIHYTE